MVVKQNLVATQRCGVCHEPVVALRVTGDYPRGEMIEVGQRPVVLTGLGAYAFDIETEYAFKRASIETVELIEVLRIHECRRRS